MDIHSGCLLDHIRHTNDIKKIHPKDYGELAAEIREFLIDRVSVHGGHLASNLGVVELTMALHLAFDVERDAIIWDVGHQSYTHKLLTGRREGFDTLREFGGMSGFPSGRRVRRIRLTPDTARLLSRQDSVLRSRGT